MKREDVRNIAIIAHVDHGKTTLVDQLLRQSGVFRKNQEIKDRVMDSKDLERERGITILSKNTSVRYEDVKINIIDTPGHADFGGEVERVLKMVNGVILVVDAFEGPMPQTKFVLKNALDLDLSVIVCVNKIDRPNARPREVVDEVLELFLELDANEEQLDSPFVFASAKGGTASADPDIEGSDMTPLFDKIISNIPAPEGEPDAPLQILISTIDYSDYLGRIGVGKIEDGTINIHDDVLLLNAHDPNKKEKVKINTLYEFEDLDRQEVKSSKFGSIVAISGIDNINIGDTICAIDNPVPLPFVRISEPTLSMNFSVNDSPFAGDEGDYLTSRHLRDRLFRELNTDVSLRVAETDSTDVFKVSGRGELHLSILIETMRREGYEFQVSKPEVLYREIDGKQMEPMESLIIDLEDAYTGTVIEKLGRRKAELLGMSKSSDGSTRLEFKIPARGLIGYRTEFLTDTRGTGIMNTVFEGYEPYKGDIPERPSGSLIAFEKGVATPYGLMHAEERGELFITPGTKVYAGMVVGRSPRNLDLEVNVTREKQLTNIRAAGSDDAVNLSPITQMTLEQSLEFITRDELVEITPTSLRIRKRTLDSKKRMRESKK